MMPRGNVLVVDDSRLMLEVLGRVLAPHFSKIFFASSCREAVRELELASDIQTVICDVILPDGTGLQLLEQIASGPRPKPAFLLITANPSEEDRERALFLGALGYLPKPISVRDIRAALSTPAHPNPRESRHRTLAKAWIIDPEWRERLVCLPIHNISTSGALLDSMGPLVVGTRLEFEIVHSEDQAIRARGTVVRVQEPSWLDPGGTGVRFDWVESLEQLNKLIRRHRLIFTYV